MSDLINTRRQSWRRVWLTIHLYLGLSVGLVFVLTGLTGSLLVFYIEIDEYLNPKLQNPLHSGEIIGLTGRWLIFISGLLPAILYITGFIRWQQKRTAKKIRSYLRIAQ